MDLEKLLKRSNKLRRSLEKRWPAVRTTLDPVKVIAQVSEHGVRHGSLNVAKELFSALQSEPAPQKRPSHPPKREQHITSSGQRKAIGPAAAKVDRRSSAPPPPELSGGREPINTRTMAQILAGQGQFTRALSIYKTLLERDPENLDLIREMEEIQKAKHASVHE